jgi:hypothetical protein
MGNRIGFHYFDDQEHYTAADLDSWLPHLEKLGASWLVLRGSLARMVPESFIRGLLTAGIEPVIRLASHPIHTPDLESLRQIFETYRRWGVHYVVLFEDANSRAAWESADWARPSLVERFLDCLLPALNAMSSAGLTPVIPPLVAGGDYWDTAFLDGLLASMTRRGYSGALHEMVVGMYHFVGNRPLDWGCGGSEAWPSAQPYLVPPGTQDQRGFYRFEWIDEIVRRHVGHSLDQLVIAGGAALEAHDLPDSPPVDPLTQAEQNMEIVRRMESGQVPPYVLNTAFWLLAAAPESPHAARAWWPPQGGAPLPIVDRLMAWRSVEGQGPSLPYPSAHAEFTAPQPAPEKPLEHYLLLPTFEWGVSDWHWDVVREYVKLFRPACGFSPHEATSSRHVTVIGNEQGIPARVEADLRAAGCAVQRIAGVDGQTIQRILEAMVEAGQPYASPPRDAERRTDPEADTNLMEERCL